MSVTPLESALSILPILSVVHSWLWYASCVSAALASLWLIRQLFRPYYQTLGSHEPQPEADRGEVPPIYPNGWFHVMLSSELRPGMVTPVSMLGRDLVAYRGADGRVRIVERYCPHNGADLGRGEVIDNNLKCPFHGWQFNETGCVDIPYRTSTARLPQVRRGGNYVCEHFNTIFIWHHAEGRAPEWEIECMEPEEGRRFFGRALHLTRCSHCMEPQENQADFGHFFQVHRSQGLVKMDWTTIDWEIDGHRATYAMTASYKLFGVTLIEAHIVSGMEGPGITKVTTYAKYLGLFDSKVIMLAMVTPVGPFRQRLAFHHYGRSRWGQPVARIFQKLVSIEVAKDMDLMATKQYRTRPMYIKEEGALIAYRKYYSQFFTEHSPRFRGPGGQAR